MYILMFEMLEFHALTKILLRDLRTGRLMIKVVVCFLLDVFWSMMRLKLCTTSRLRVSTMETHALMSESHWEFFAATLPTGSSRMACSKRFRLSTDKERARDPPMRRG